MTTRFRMYHEDEDLWLYYELDEEHRATRHIGIRAANARPVAAASLAEVLHLRDHADLPAMQRYERRFGVLPEGSLEEWRDHAHTEITADEFERVWDGARRALEGRA